MFWDILNQGDVSKTYALRRASGCFVDVRLTQLFTREFQVTRKPKRVGF